MHDTAPRCLTNTPETQVACDCAALGDTREPTCSSVVRRVHKPEDALSAGPAPRGGSWYGHGGAGARPPGERSQARPGQAQQAEAAPRAHTRPSTRTPGVGSPCGDGGTLDLTEAVAAEH